MSGNNIPEAKSPEYRYKKWLPMTGLSNNEEPFSAEEANYYPPTKQLILKDGRGLRELYAKEVATVSIGDDDYRTFLYVDSDDKVQKGFFPLLVDGYVALTWQTQKKETRKQNTLMTEDITKKPKYKKVKVYYVSYKGKAIERFRPNKKNVAALFPKSEQLVKDYIKSEKLKMRKEEDLIKAIEYGNSLSEL